MTRAGRILGGLAQLAVLGAAAGFLLQAARTAWPTLNQVQFRPAAGPLALASVLTVATYALLIRAWVYSLTWWGQHLRYRAALYIWFTTNLARFIPGAVWQFVGLAALAVEHALSPLAATAAVLLQQLLFLITGLALSLAMFPGFLGAWTRGLPVAAGLALAGALLGTLALGLPLIAPRLGRLTGRLLRREILFPAPPPRGLTTYLGALLAAWLCYGVAFWLFGRAALGEQGPNLLLSVAAFTTSYVAGLIAVFAPGGIVVREAALVACLAPALGPSSALLLALGSRLWLLVLEFVTAGLVFALYRLGFLSHPPDHGRAS